MRRLLLIGSMLAFIAVSWSLSDRNAFGQGTVGSGLEGVGPSVQIVPATTALFTCFELQHGERAGVNVSLVTNDFGEDTVRVGRLEMMCESAAMYDLAETAGPMNAQATRIFACYDVFGANDPDVDYTLTTEGFGTDEVEVGRTNLLCEEASKKTADGEIVGVATGEVWQCFRLRHTEDVDIEVNLVTHNFGADHVEVKDADTLCESAIMQMLAGTTGAAPSVETTLDETTLMVLGCYKLDEGEDPDETVTLTTMTFGSQEVNVRDAELVCQQAQAADGTAPSTSAPSTSSSSGPQASASSGPSATTSTVPSGLKAKIDNIIELLMDHPSAEAIDEITKILEGDD